jgi:hypothetical protein
MGSRGYLEGVRKRKFLLPRESNLDSFVIQPIV